MKQRVAFFAGAMLLGWVMYEIGAACPRRPRLVAQPIAQKQPVAKTAAAKDSDAVKRRSWPMSARLRMLTTAGM